MKKVIFIENSYSTDIYLGIAKELIKLEIGVVLLCWNKWFARKWTDFEVINLPPCNADSSHDFIVSARESRYYRLSQAQFMVNEKIVTELILQLSPSIIVGEPTLAYEQQIALIARNIHVPYVYISTSRLIPGRIVLYNNLFMKAIDLDAGSLNSPADTDIFVKNKRRCILIFEYTYNHLAQLLIGTRRVAPSIFRKIYLELNSKYYFFKLTLLKQRAPNTSSVVLFPLQMQPESNTDVWAMPYYNQLELLKKFSLNPDICVLVKLNPTSKYEINGDLFHLIAKSNNLIVCQRDLTMPEALEKCSAVFSNVGSVILEAVKSGKNVISLNLDNDLVNLPGVTKIKDITEITPAFLKTLNNENAHFDLEHILHREMCRSVPGHIYDPLRNNINNEELNSKNISKILQVFLQQV